MREHLKIERSTNLRKFFFANQTVYICDACNTNPKHIYPWTTNILEIHHLLPLSSSIMINSKGTSIDDVVALCPNCHKSIHEYYKQWLKSKNQEDFSSKQQALLVYNESKLKVTL
jgi:predicted HNH restriction endonuclease